MKFIHRTIHAALMLSLGSLAVAGAALCAATAADQSAVLAVVGKHKITEQEVEQKLGLGLETVRAEIYEVKEHGVDQMVSDLLIRQAAEKAHMSVDDYLKQQVFDKMPQPTESQIRQTYEMFKPQLRHSYEEEKPGLIAYLKEHSQQDALSDLVGRLRAEQNVQIFLEPPRFQVPTDNHPSLGPKDAPVTIVEFGDFDCPFTRKSEEPLKQVMAKYGKKVRLVFISHPLWLHQYASQAEKGARCADDQGKFWPYHDALLSDKANLTSDEVKAIAARLQLDTKKFNDCYDQSRHMGDSANDMALAGALRVEGTPTFYVNGRLVFGAVTFDQLSKIVDEELANRKVEHARK
jgi:protein-disulfide isomerase